MLTETSSKVKFFESDGKLNFLPFVYPLPVGLCTPSFFTNKYSPVEPFDALEGEERKAIELLEEKYAEENADPINAAKNGYVDNIIEPQFVRSYVISALQMIVR